MMTKLMILLMVVTLSGMLAATDVLLVNYALSEEGESLIQALMEYVRESDGLELTDAEKPGDICLFVKEYSIPKGIDPDLRSFTVTFTVVDQPFGDYVEYVPIGKSVSGTWYAATEAFIMDANDMTNGLWETIDRIDTMLHLFLSAYGQIGNPTY